MIRWRLLFAVCALGVGSIACQPPQPKRSLPVTLSFETFTGSNGLRVFTIPDRSAEFLAFHVRYKTGGVDDPSGKEGLAHLVEHLMFTKRIELEGQMRTIGSRIDAISIAHNAETRHDITHYWTVVPRENLGEMFAIETVRMASGCEGLDEAEFAREKEVVRNEIRSRSAGDYGLLYPASLSAFYGDHPYAKSVGGTDESLRAITLADVCAFFKNNVAPSKATFYVVGNITSDEVRQVAVSWLQRIPSREVPKPKAITKAPSAVAKKTVSLDVEAPYLLASWKIPMGDEAFPLLNDAIGTLRSRMGFFVSKYELGSQVFVGVRGGARAPIVVMSVKLRSAAKLDDAIDAARKAGNAVEFWMPREKFDPGRRDMFDVHSEANEALLASFDSPIQRGTSFADLDDRSDGKRFLVEEVQAVVNVSASELRSMASNMFDDDQASFLFVKPTGRIRRGGGASGTAGASDDHSSNHWLVPADPAMANSPHPLPYLPEVSVVTDDYRLDSGMRVILAKSGDLPLVRASLTFLAGNAAEPKNRVGLAQLAGRGRVTDDLTRYRSRALRTRIDYMIARFSRSKRGNSYSQDAVEKNRKTLRQTYSQPSIAARIEYLKKRGAALYGADHPYATRGLPTVGDFKKINRSELLSFAKNYYGGSSGTLIFAGDYDTKLLKQYIKKHYDHWEKRGRPKAPLAVARGAAVSEQAIVTGIDPGATQLSVEIDFAGPRGVDEHYPARLVLASLLGGRLRALREERGLTYGVRAGYTPAIGPGYWELSAEVDPDRAQEGVAAFLSVLRKLRATGDDQQFATGFVLARRSVVNGLLVTRTVPRAVIGQLEFASTYGLPLNYQSELAKAVAAVTPKQVRALLATELSEDRAVIGLFGTRAAVVSAQRGVTVTPAAPAEASESASSTP